MAETVPIGTNGPETANEAGATPRRHHAPAHAPGHPPEHVSEHAPPHVREHAFHHLVHTHPVTHTAARARFHPHGAAEPVHRGHPTVSASAALTQAMSAEAVPQSWHPGLQFIMMQESGGRVDVRNPASSARGLFQLTAANYHLNPHGAHSFGNAVEEAQGGIRYIEERYGTVDNAVAHWRYRHTY